MSFIKLLKQSNNSILRSFYLDEADNALRVVNSKPFSEGPG